MKVKGRVSVVTGASSGMGRSLVVQLAQKGSHVACCDVNMETLEETVRLARAANPRVKVTGHHCDVADKHAVGEFCAQVLNEHEGKVHLLFANAGISAPGAMLHDESMSAEQIADHERRWDRCFDIDYFGVLFCVRAFLPHIAKQEEGYLALTSSINSFWMWPEHGAYASAKFACRGLTEALICETYAKAPHVHVAAIMPGGVKTGIAGNLLVGDEHKAVTAELNKGFEDAADLSPDEAAEWILDGIAKNSTRILVGWDAVLIDYFSRFLGPHKAYDMYKAFNSVGVTNFSAEHPEETRRQMQAVGALGWAKWFYNGGAPFMTFVAFPMLFFKMRRNPVFKAAVLAAAAYQTKRVIAPKL